MNTYGSLEKGDFTHHQGVSADGYQINNLSTASVAGAATNVLATTLIPSHGFSNIVTTSSGSLVYRLDTPNMSGLRKTIQVAALVNTSSPALLYAGSTAFEACFVSVNANTSNSMATMYQGAVLELLSVSTNKWIVLSNCTAASTAITTFSSST